MEKVLNWAILFILSIQFVLCFTIFLTAMLVYWVGEGRDHEYHGEDDTHPAFFAMLQFFSMFLLLNTMVPISLIVTLEIVKVMQAIFI